MRFGQPKWKKFKHTQTGAHWIMGQKEWHGMFYSWVNNDRRCHKKWLRISICRQYFVRFKRHLIQRNFGTVCLCAVCMSIQMSTMHHHFDSQMIRKSIVRSHETNRFWNGRTRQRGTPIIQRGPVINRTFQIWLIPNSSRPINYEPYCVQIQEIS